MRTAGRRAGAAPVPEWWAHLLSARHRRLRAAILGWLARDACLSGPHIRQAARSLRGQYAPEEIAAALCGLESDGLAASERRREPVRFGGREMREWTYWRQTPAGAEAAAAIAAEVIGPLAGAVRRALEELDAGRPATARAILECALEDAGGGGRAA